MSNYPPAREFTNEEADEFRAAMRDPDLWKKLHEKVAKKSEEIKKEQKEAKDNAKAQSRPRPAKKQKANMDFTLEEIALLNELLNDVEYKQTEDNYDDDDDDILGLLYDDDEGEYYRKKRPAFDYGGSKSKSKSKKQRKRKADKRKTRKYLKK